MGEAPANMRQSIEEGAISVAIGKRAPIWAA
jgi:hypothetical protein